MLSSSPLRKKLLRDEKVEVRSVEEGFLGSWHPGTIIVCEDSVRVVRYDHILNDEGSSSLTQLVKVSPIIDGAPIVVDRNYRGLIRPFQPPCEFGSWCPRYGQCVDFSYEDAWWEGVIIDPEEGCEQRRVFFPDMGDEMLVRIDMLRLTKVWNGATDEWKTRGTWMLLEIIEEAKKDWPMFVSVKQIWYEVRMIKDFQKLRDWISSQRYIWKKLVFRVLIDYIKITVNQLFIELNSSENSEELEQSLLEYSEPALEALLIKNFSPQETRSLLLTQKPRAFRKRSEMVALVIEPDYCPEAVMNYYLFCESDKKSNRKLTAEGKLTSLKAKKHLSAIGWSFYSRMKGKRKVLQYTSPNDGKMFYNLVSACKWHIEGGTVHSVGVVAKSRKKRKHDKSPSIQDSLFPKRRRKSLESVELRCLDSDPSIPVRQSKRIKQITASPSQKVPRTVLSWLIDNNVVLPRAKVYYYNMNNARPLAEGRVTRKGINCSCCGEIFSLGKFEAHAGSTSQIPSASIFLKDGRSLLQCQLQLKNCMINRALRAESKGRPCNQTNDYICSICNDGGELILCDQCPSSYHTDCLGLKGVSDGDWFCPPCCCQICGHNKFDNKNELDKHSVRVCGQCEKQYHVECLENNDVKNSYQEEYWFCGDACQQIFCFLHKILGKPQSTGTENLTWTLLKYTKSESYDNDEDCLVEAYSKLNVALGVMHECFEPFKEPSTGRDMVEEVIFSRRSELNRLNFQGFYTVLLERDEELISAATVRIYGKSVAEVPLVATRSHYRRLGMCRILMDELEKNLIELGVERLVLPAVPSVLKTWTTSFGFSAMNDKEKLQLVDFTFLNFQGTVFCQKYMMRNSSLVESNLLTETQATSSDHVNKSVNIELDGNNTMPKDSSEEVKEDADIAKRESTCTAEVTNEGGGCSDQPATAVDGELRIQVDPSTPSSFDQPSFKGC